MNNILMALCAALALFSTSGAALGDTPNYIAQDYNVPGNHPSLTPAQVTRIVKILARVKPCQRSLVRYVLWNDSLEKDDGIAFFFKSENGLYIIGEPGRLYYPPMGIFSSSTDDPNTDAQEKQGIQWYIDRQPCPK